MKFFLIICLLVSLSVQAQFLPNTDIPMMDGLIIDENDSFSFDTPEGQIMTVTARTTASAKEILAFYKESLEALGWNRKSATEYRRDQDNLVLKIVPSARQNTVKLQLTFANK